MRVSTKKKAKNDEWRSDLSNLERKFQKAIKANNKEEAKNIVRELQKTLDRAARRNVIHKNAASRNKSRFSSALAKVK